VAGTEHRVLVVDDHPVVARGLAALFAGADWVSAIDVVGTVAGAVEQATRHRPTLAVVDVRLPDGDGLDLVRRLRSLAPGCRVLVLTMDDSDATARRAVEAGAAGFLHKDAAPELIVDALRTLSRGGTVLTPDVLRRLAERKDDVVPPPFDRLTPRERALAGLVGAGLANPAIAARLHVSEKTVRNQLSAVLVKVGAPDRVHLALLVREHHLDRPA
jgi:DNA-binding NarL/FixJ family response regulator